jgi:thioredoxin reductase
VRHLTARPTIEEQTMTPDHSGHVAILGAGPVGLDAALACVDAGRSCTVYEAGARVGTHVRAWGHVRLFTPWELNLSPRMRHALTGIGRAVPDHGGCPTGDEFATTMLDPLAELPGLAGHIRLRHRVTAVGRAGLLKHEEIGTERRAAARFRLLLDTPDGERVEQADIVWDCTGTYGQPNTIDEGGIPAPGERALAGRIVRTIPRIDDPLRWAGTVVLVGAGKSAQTARDLAALPDTRVEWIVRNPSPGWGAIPADTLPERQALVETAQALAAGASDRATVHVGTTVDALHPHGKGVRVTLTGPSGGQAVMADRIVGLTGYVGDAGLYRQLQVHECYATAAPMNLAAALLGAASLDCLAQPALGADVLRNPEPNFVILGGKSYGRTNTFLLRAGYEQVDQALSLSPPPRRARGADDRRRRLPDRSGSRAGHRTQ